MTRLQDAFEALIDEHRPGDPDALLASARAEVAGHGPGRWRSVGLVAAAAAVVLGLGAAVLVSRDDDPGSVTTGTTAVTSSTSTSTSTSTSAPSDPVPGGRFTLPVTAVASDAGVTVADDTGQDVRITSEPARVAFATADQVVFQGDDPDDTIYPIAPGPIRVWEDDEVRTLQIGPTGRTTLLDAATVDGTPLVLTGAVSGRTPDDTFEDLTTVDLDTGTVRMVARIPAWESETIQAQLLPDGSVIRLVTGEGHTFLQRWRPGEPEFLWSRELPGRPTTMAVGPDSVTTIEQGTIDGTSVDLTVTEHAFATGLATGPATIVPIRDTAPLPVWCEDWLVDMLSCSRVDDDPVGVMLDGTVRPLPTVHGARITMSY